MFYGDNFSIYFQASELLLFNKKITAKEACDRNLVTEVFPDSVFVKETETRIQQYAKLPKVVSIVFLFAVCMFVEF